MEKIDLQNRTMAIGAQIECYWFENENIGLENTLFHRITVSLKEFDSGLDYVEQPTNTDIVLDWYELNLDDPHDLSSLNLTHQNYPEAEGSIYLGGAHNWCDVLELKVHSTEDGTYEVRGVLNVEFENEGVACNEKFQFVTTAPKIIDT